MYFKKRRWFLILESLLLSLVTGFQDQSVPNVNAITGSNVTLTILKHPLASYQRLTWLHTTNQKILEYFPNGKKTVFESVFKDRVDVDKTNGALHIYNVSKEDRGDYYMRMLHEIEDQRKITMEVYDLVSKPAIVIEKTEDLTDSCHLRLSCKVEDQGVDYTWYEDSGPFPQRNPGYVLEITITPHNKSTFYTCQVSNPVSSENDTLYFIPPCTLARSSGVHWIAAWLVVTLSIIPSILLA